MFCASILMLKLCLLAIDPLPKFFMGDSGSYLWTALTGWIPHDRSYFYGYVIRWVALSTESLTALLLLQSFLSALTALFLTYICRSMFALSARTSYVIGFLCALDPFQLVWERYVMTETISLFIYVAGLYFCFLYLKDRRIRHLVIVQGLWVLLIGFRMSYLLAVQVSAVLLPILAFYPLLIPTERNRRSAQTDRFRALKLGFGHLLTSIALMLLLHGAYKKVNGLLTGRESAYLYETGLHLLSFWAPILVPADAPDERLARIIEHGNEFDIKDLTARNSQRYAPGHLIDRWEKVEPVRRRANQIAKKTALHALRRNPLQVLDLAAQTFAQYWNLKDLWRYANFDLGHNDLTLDQKSVLAERFHFATDGQIAGVPPTVLQQYFLFSWPYCYFLLLSPIFGALAVYFAREKLLALLLISHLVITLGTALAFTVAPSVRYLQPVSLLALLSIALCFPAILSNRSPEQPFDRGSVPE
jgi:hypothetical protein